MASEIRVDKINSLSGVGTVTLSPTGVDIAGITTAATLRATTGIVTSLTVGSLTSLGDVDIADTIVHTGDTNTKIRFPAADTITAETGGNERLRVDSAGRLMLGTTTEGFATYGDKFTIADSGHCGMTIRSGTSSDGNIYFSDGDDGSADEVRGYIEYNHSENRLTLGTNGTQRLRITSAGLVGIATATPRAQFDVIKSTGNVIALFEGSNAAQNHRVRIDASGGSSTSALSISNSNSNNQTSMYHSGGNNSMVIMGGQTAGAEPTAGTAVATFASGGDVTVNTGNLVIGTSGKGISFAATADSGGTMANELLDDYEEGTWTPKLAPSSSYASIHENGIGRYTKIGNMVHCTMGWFDKDCTAFPTNEQIMIYNFPFTIVHVGNNADAHYIAPFHMAYNVQFGQQDKHYFYSNHNQTTAKGLKTRDGTSWQTWSTADWNQSGLYFDTQMTYMTTS